jgi:hypothetical protein
MIDQSCFQESTPTDHFTAPPHRPPIKANPQSVLSVVNARHEFGEPNGRLPKEQRELNKFRD